MSRTLDRSLTVDQAPPPGFIGVIHSAESEGESSISNFTLRSCGEAWSPRATTFGSNVVFFMPSGPKTLSCIAFS